MTTPVEHVTAATSAIRSATAAVGRTLTEIETLEDWKKCLSLVAMAAWDIGRIEDSMVTRLDLEERSKDIPGFPLLAVPDER